MRLTFIIKRIWMDVFYLIKFLLLFLARCKISRQSNVHVICLFWTCLKYLLKHFRLVLIVSTRTCLVLIMSMSTAKIWSSYNAKILIKFFDRKVILAIEN